MPNFNPRNERIKKEYFRYLKEADRKSVPTIDGVRKAIGRYEAYTGFKDFRTFNREQAVAFKKRLATTKAARGLGPLAKSTLLSTVNALKGFFKWLSCQPSYRAHIRLTDIEYLNLTDKETRAAREPRFKIFPTLEQIRHVISAMPAESPVDRRNRALIAFTILTGMRDAAMASLRLKHVDLERMLVLQDPREVRTKRSKRIDTFIFPVGPDLEEIVIGWIRYLREDLLFGNDDPVFPRTRVVQDEDHCFAVSGIEPVFWSNTQPIREIFRQAFARVGLSYFNPHSFRDTLVQIGERRSPTIEHFKAWSQNLGHEHVQTTLTSYGTIGPHRQGELVRSVQIDAQAGNPRSSEQLLAEIRKLVVREADTMGAAADPPGDLLPEQLPEGV